MGSKRWTSTYFLTPTHLQPVSSTGCSGTTPGAALMRHVLALVELAERGKQWILGSGLRSVKDLPLAVPGVDKVTWERVSSLG
jgi:hypothetical protein